MRAIRIRKRLDSHVLDLPEAAGMIGRIVDIIILDETEPENGRQDMAALDAIAGKDLIDEDAIRELRRISRI